MHNCVRGGGPSNVNRLGQNFRKFLPKLKSGWFFMAHGVVEFEAIYLITYEERILLSFKLPYIRVVREQVFNWQLFTIMSII